MDSSHADVIVVGLGAHGSATAFQLARRGVRVLGLDRFDPPHDLGSSHGESRVTRQATAEGPAYVPLAVRSQQLWREIEAETHVDLFTDCGVLMLALAGGGGPMHGRDDWLGATIDLARKFDIAHELLTPGEVTARFPAFSAAGDEVTAYFEPGGGFVRPEAAVGAQLELARRHGADLRANVTVTGLARNGSGVTVTTSAGDLTADHVVLAAGAWLPPLLDDAGLGAHFTIFRQALHWFAPEPARAADFAPERCPVFLWTFGAGPADFFYGFPALGGTAGGVKVATEQFERPTTATADADLETLPGDAAAMYDHCVRGRLPGLSPRALRSVACRYTATPDGEFAIGAHPDLDGVTVVSACSGHGFKCSAAIGEAVAQTIVDGRPHIDLTPFALPNSRDRPSGETD